MKYHNTGVDMAAVMIMPLNNFQLIPATKSTEKPAIPTSNAVPKSGCLQINNTGTVTSKQAASMRQMPGGKDLSEEYHATTMGTASFINSDGWKRRKPRSSQRLAPLPISPATRTTISNTTPARYNQKDKRASCAGDIWVNTSSNAKASISLPHCRISIPVSMPPAL